jgi:hypothetical protein
LETGTSLYHFGGFQLGLLCGCRGILCKRHAYNCSMWTARHSTNK